MIPQEITRKLATLALAAVGGVLATWIGAPLPWMIGAMIAVALAALAGAPVVGPTLWRVAMIAVVGVGLGRLFNIELLHQASLWAKALVVLMVATAAMGLASYAVLRLGRYSRANAALASVPGGITEMVVIAQMLNLDTPRVSVAHATRILVAASLVPLWFRFADPEAFDSAIAPILGSEVASGRDLTIMALCALLGAWVGIKTKLPGGMFLLPMLFAALATLGGGFGQGGWPPWLMAIAQITLGAGIGARFAAAKSREVAGLALISSAAALAMLLVACALAFAVSGWVGQESSLMILALAPGGFIEMSLVAMAIGADPAFVALMHIARLFLTLGLSPGLAKIARRAQARERLAESVARD